MSGTRLSFVTLNIPDNRVLQNGLINGNLHYINLSRYTNYVYCIVRTCVGRIMIGIDFFYISSFQLNKKHFIHVICRFNKRLLIINWCVGK